MVKASPLVDGLRFWPKLLIALALLGLSLWHFHLCGSYHDGLGLSPGRDPFLDSLPRVDLTFLTTYVWIAFHFLAGFYWLGRDRARVPYIVAAIALVTFVRNIFVALTPVGPPAGMLPLYSDQTLGFLRERLFFDSELFFSGHTALPFLYFLVTRPAGRMRWFFLAFSVVMAAGVLFTRNHYTIDVLGAWFITYAVYRLSRPVFGWLL